MTGWRTDEAHRQRGDYLVPDDPQISTTALAYALTGGLLIIAIIVASILGVIDLNDVEQRQPLPSPSYPAVETTYVNLENLP